MSYVLTYTILNSQVATTQVEIEYQGQPATVSQSHALIEAIPTDPSGKTLTLVLPATVVEEFPEGSTLKVTVEVEGDTD